MQGGLNVTLRVPIDERSIMSNPPISERQDLAHLFPAEPRDWNAEEETGQLRLSIASAEEAIARGEIPPRPTFRDIPKELREFRRWALYAHAYGFLTFSELTEAAALLTALGSKYTESELKVLLKRYLWIIIREKAYAETLDGSLSELFALVFKFTFENIPFSFERKVTKARTAEGIHAGIGDFMDALRERPDVFIAALREPGGKTLAEEFPQFYEFFGNM